MMKKKKKIKIIKFLCFLILFIALNMLNINVENIYADYTIDVETLKNIHDAAGNTPTHNGMTMAEFEAEVAHLRDGVDCNKCYCSKSAKLVESSLKYPTCTTSGETTIICSCPYSGSSSNCYFKIHNRACNQGGHSHYNVLGHEYDSSHYIIVKQPTCTKSGSAYLYCKSCGGGRYDFTLNPIGHNWSSIDSEITNRSFSCSNDSASGSIPEGYHYGQECTREGCDCKQTKIANWYFMHYTNTQADINDGASGDETVTYTYDNSYNWHSGAGFLKTWNVEFDGRGYGTSNTGSTTATSGTQYSYAHVVSWTYNGSIKPVNSSGLRNLTSTHRQTLECTANYGPQTSVVFPGETAKTVVYDGRSVNTPIIIKDGYTLVGWTLNPNTPSIEYPHDYGMTNAQWLQKSNTKTNVQFWPYESRVPDYKGQRYYAIWIPNELTITYNRNDAKYDSTHSTTISGKTFMEFYNSYTNTTKATGSLAKTSMQYDDTFTLRKNTYTKQTNGFYGNTINYTFVGWSLKPNFSTYSSNSRTTSNENVKTTPNTYYGYNLKTSYANANNPNLLTLSSFDYTKVSSTYNKEQIYFYDNETIKNFRNNGGKAKFNLVSSKGGNANLYAVWIPENQRPYTYFRLATKQYYEDSRWNNLLEDIVYDNYPANIYTGQNSTIVYDDMPIYLNTVYYDPEGRVDDGQYEIEYQYSIDNGKTWYQLIDGITTPNFYTTTTTISKTNLHNSYNLDGVYTIDNAQRKQFIYDSQTNSTTSDTLKMLEIHFYANSNNQNVKTDSSLTTLIRSRARDTVDYPIYITKAVRKEDNQLNLLSSTKATLQKPLWSTGNYVYSYSNTNINGTYINEYNGSTNSWNNQKAFVESSIGGKNDYIANVDNGGSWYTKTITCYAGNSTNDDDKIIATLDNKYTYPMYDYTRDNGVFNNQNGNLYLNVSRKEEAQTSENETILIDEILENRGYVTYDNYGNLVVDYRNLYKPKVVLIRQSQVKQSNPNNINNRYSIYPNADESIGFINLSANLDNVKHYNNGKNPTYSIDNRYSRKYYHTNNTQSDTQYNKQFSNYFIAIYDEKGNEVLTQAGASKTNVTYTKNANGIYVPANGSQYTFLKNETKLSFDITGHIYNSYEQMISDIYKYTNSMFSESSDMLNGEYTIYFAVCDKSWNLYSPNKWAIEISTLTTTPRLSFYDIGITDFKQTDYKNEDKVQTLWLKTDANNKPISIKNGDITYKFPMYKLSGLTTYQTINEHKIYINNFALTQAQQRYQLNTDYVKDTSLGYKTNPIYNVQGGYNFTINIDVQGADYSELNIYNVKDPTKPIQVIQKNDNIVINKNNTNTLMSYTCRNNGSNTYTICFPEQTKIGEQYYMELKVTKTTLTNTTHELSATNKGTNVLQRTFRLGSPENPLITIIESSLVDIGVDLMN